MPWGTTRKKKKKINRKNCASHAKLSIINDIIYCWLHSSKQKKKKKQAIWIKGKKLKQELTSRVATTGNIVQCSAVQCGDAWNTGFDEFMAIGAVWTRRARLFEAGWLAGPAIQSKSPDLITFSPNLPYCPNNVIIQIKTYRVKKVRWLSFFSNRLEWQAVFVIGRSAVQPHGKATLGTNKI